VISNMRLSPSASAFTKMQPLAGKAK